MKNTILKLLLAIGIIAFATSITAVSCGKTAGGGGNNNANNNSGNNSGGGGNGGGSGNTGCTGICPTTNLTLTIPVAAVGYVKISGNTVTVNANALTRVHSDADNDNRGFEDTIGIQYKLIIVRYPGTPPPPTMLFASRVHVTKDTITMGAVSTGMGFIPRCTSSESGDNALASAAGGAHCRLHANDVNNRFYLRSYLGTVFNNTKTTSHARGLMRCSSELLKDNPITGAPHSITDTLTFDASEMSCFLSPINSAGAATAARIDDAWVTDSGSTSEMELYAIGIDVTGKTIPQWSDAPGYGLTEFKKAHDNADFKRLLRTNPWGELKFKVKIVASTSF